MRSTSSQCPWSHRLNSKNKKTIKCETYFPSRDRLKSRANIQWNEISSDVTPQLFFWNIIQVVTNGTFDITYNRLHCKNRFESDHWENMFHQCKFYFWFFLHFHRLYYIQNMIPMPSILKRFLNILTVTECRMRACITR